MIRFPASPARHPALPRAESPSRQAAARLLRLASKMLARLARRLHVRVRAEPMPAVEPVLEFYAEAGAPEGALYLDGQRIGVLSGVTRL